MTARPGARVLVRRMTYPSGNRYWVIECSESTCTLDWNDTLPDPWADLQNCYGSARDHARTCTALHLARLLEQVGAALVEIERLKSAALAPSTMTSGGLWRGVGYGASADVLTRLTGVTLPKAACKHDGQRSTVTDWTGDVVALLCDRCGLGVES